MLSYHSGYHSSDAPDIAPLTDRGREVQYPLQIETGCQVRTLRETIGPSVTVVAERMGVYATTVRNWESGQVLMSKKLWEKMNDLFAAK